MKKFFPIILLLLTASFSNSQSLQNSFNDVRDLSSYVSSEFSLIASEYTDLESTTVNEGGWAWRNYNDEKDSFTDLANISQDLSTFFTSLEIEFGSIANVFANFDGSYSSLSGLPSLFDGSFSSLSGTPTTLAGYGITDSGLKYVTEGGNTGVRLSSANAANHGDIGNTAVDLSYQSSASSTTGATGQSSFAVGLDSTASGDYSTAMSYGTEASGDFSTAMGRSTKATGVYSTAIGDSTTASAYADTAMGFSTTASGNSSTAMGESTLASGYVSLALGKNTISSAEQSIAAGYGSIAEGNRSMALGFYSKASGTSSTALGLHTVSESASSLVIGTWNELISGDEQTLFVIGNGGWDATRENYLGTEESRSNALKVLVDGTTTIAGSVTASSFFGDGSGLTSLPLVVESISEGGNTGVRLSSANAANHGDIGNTAVDLSYQSSASSTTGATGQSSFAVGLDSTASGAHSVSGGYASVASGDTSVALGNSAQATGTFSYSIGHSSEANGDNSVALGFFNKSDGQNATAIGRGNLATGETATATGQFTSASGKFSLSSGLYSNASGTTSVALGNNTIADGYGTLATGYFNTANANPQADSFDQSNTAFVIGNGTSQNRSNAFKVLFDGTTTIAGDLSINSDARLKANIVSLGATLSKLLQIDGKSYTIKKDKREKQKIGLLAQDIEKVFPELVSESNGIKSVNYQGLVPVLINALKEQEEKIKSQENKLLKLESLVQDLVDNQ
jgi:hypothetical protein